MFVYQTPAASIPNHFQRRFLAVLTSACIVQPFGEKSFYGETKNPRGRCRFCRL
jgi:hypothetical protein